jgi:hypothetical protein
MPIIKSQAKIKSTEMKKKTNLGVTSINQHWSMNRHTKYASSSFTAWHTWNTAIEENHEFPSTAALNSKIHNHLK